MSPTIRRCTGALAAALVAFGVVVVAASPAAADPFVPRDDDGPLTTSHDGTTVGPGERPRAVADRLTPGAANPARRAM